MKIFAAFTVLFLGFFCTDATARAHMYFGERDSLHYLQDVEITGEGGESLVLAERTTIRFFIAGLYFIDHGPVLRPKTGNEGFYYTLTDELIAKYQQQGLLPTPLPIYKPSIFDYVIGYSLWLMIAYIFIHFKVEAFFKKRKLIKKG